MLPMLLVAFPRIYSLAWLIVTMGVAVRIVPMLERRASGFRRFVRVTFPAAVGTVVILGASIATGDRIKRWREDARPLPAPGSPNVLLIVLDTVAATHLDLHGYGRPTATTLVELAGRGIRFDRARAASSWTLPSHASMFTGMWMHELPVGWLTPLDATHRTLAEFLGSRGYATAGFVANTRYCASDSGLGRGFTHYRDYIFPELTALKTGVLFNRALAGMQASAYFLEDWLAFARLQPLVGRLWRAVNTDRKGAAEVSREFLDWLTRRSGSERPFLAFLNFNDAHYPYRLPPGRLHRFGVEPADTRQRILIQHWWELDKSRLSPHDVAFVADVYDDCVADLDEQLGKLLDELGRRGVLDRTWLIVTADHGESFGEHNGVFCHGTSLYQTELHVPLLVIPPGGGAARSIGETVSLRDIPATIVDVVGQEADSPFPGRSLARYWRGASPLSMSPPNASSDPALAEVVPEEPLDHDAWGIPRRLWPLGSLQDGDWSYIRREGDVHEELFHLSEDARERRNLAGDPAARTTLERMRGALGRLTAGPLTPGRFRP